MSSHTQGGGLRPDEAEKEAAAEEQFPLHGDILELILSRVPLIHLLPALRVSRSWNHAVTSSLRHLNHPKPWLLLHSQSSRSSHSTATRAYDPRSRHWLRLQQRSASPKHIPTLRSSGNLLYSLSPSKLSFSVDPLHLTWHHLDGPLVWRSDPIVSLVGNRIVVAGGACDFEDDPLAVETYDLDTRTWSSCDSMPSALRDCSASKWLSVAADENRMYVMEKATGALHVYDTRDMTWCGPIDLGVGREVCWSVIGAIPGGLVMVGVIGAEVGNAKGVKVWEVELETWGAREMGEMPQEMVVKLKGAGSVGVCCSKGGFLYVCGEREGSGVAWCELGKAKAGCRWGWVADGWGRSEEDEERLVFTCAEVGLEELNRAMMSRDLMLVED